MQFNATKCHASMILIFSALIFSCKNAYDGMIEKFDENLKGKQREDKSIQGPGFTEQSMMMENYVLADDGYFSLSAPEGGATYEWKLSRPDLKTPVILGSSRQLNYEMPGIFSKSISNFLFLTVTDADGKEYKDMATIIFK